MGQRLTKSDCEALTEQFPELNCSLSRQVVWGTLPVRCSHVLGSSQIKFDDEGPNFLEDDYEIRIDFTKEDHFGCPKVFEESGKVARLAEKEGIPVTDLHVNSDEGSSCCLGIYPNYEWKSLVDFLYDLVLPFLYWQTYRRENGEPPWDGLAHGDDGLREAMSITSSTAEKGSNRNQRCPCGSGRKYKKCCMKTDAKLRQAVGKPL